jgi:hypothetical protein
MPVPTNKINKGGPHTKPLILFNTSIIFPSTPLFSLYNMGVAPATFTIVAQICKKIIVFANVYKYSFYEQKR